MGTKYILFIACMLCAKVECTSCDDVKNAYQLSQCCEKHGSDSASCPQECHTDLYDKEDRTPSKVCTPVLGTQLLMKFPFMANAPIPNTVGFNVMFDAGINMTAANEDPTMANVGQWTDSGLTGLETPLTTGFKVAWLRGDGTFPSDAWLPATHNATVLHTNDFATFAPKTILTNRQFLTLYFVIIDTASDARCMARYEGTGGMPDIAVGPDSNEVKGKIVGTMITDCSDPRVKTLLDNKHIALEWSFLDYNKINGATLSFYEWMNSEECLPLKMGITGWMMV